MANVRHTINKIEPNRALTFDEQLWPVIVALAVLSGLTIGTVLTVLNGPWMWGSLIALPAVIAVMVFVLAKISQRWVRRSLQIGLLLSLAAHLLFLIIAYKTDIFASLWKPVQYATSTQVPPEPIEFSSQQQPPTWNQPSDDPVPDPETEQVEKEEERVTTPVEKVQPIPVKEEKPTRNPKMVRKKNPTDSVPKSGESLSKLSRNSEKQSRKSAEMQIAAAESTARRANKQTSEERSTQNTEVKKQSTASQAIQKQRKEESENVASARTVKRRETQTETQQQAANKSEPKRSTARPKIEPASSIASKSQPTRAKPTENARSTATSEPTKRSTQSQSIQKRSVQDQPKSERKIVSSRRTESDSAPAAQTARNRSSRPRRTEKRLSPKTLDVASKSERPKAATKRTESRPSLSASQLTKQKTRSDLSSRMPKAASEPRLSPSDQVARNRTRRETNAQQASAEIRANPSERPRRANQIALESSTNKSIEAPSLSEAPSSNSDSMMASERVAISKSQSGIAGSGISPNMGQETQSIQSPAMRASDSARRERAVSNTSEQQALSPRQISKIGRSVASLTAPQNATPATSKIGTRAGTPNPKQSTDSASASLNTSMATAHRGDISADKGTTDVDVGPTKVVAGRATKQTSGGGQSEINLAQPARSSAQSSRHGTAEPSLVAANLSATPKAPQGDSSAQLHSDQSDMDANSVAVNRQGGDQPVTVGPSAAMVEGRSREASSANDAGEPSSRLVRNENQGEEGEDDEDEEDEEDSSNRARVARNSTSAGPSVEDTPLASNSRRSGSASTDESESSLGDVAVQQSKASGGDSGQGPSMRMSASDEGSGIASANGSNSSKRAARADRGDGESENAIVSNTPSRSRRGTGRSMELDFSQGQANAADGKSVASSTDGSEAESGSVNVERRALGGSSIGPSATRILAAAATSMPLMHSPRAGGKSDGESTLSSSASKSSSTGRATAELDLPNATAGIGNARNPIPNAAGNSSEASDIDRVSTVRRNQSGGISMDIAAEEGAGGLESEYEPNVGVNSRRGTRETDQLMVDQPNRFRRKVYGGELAVNPTAIVAKKAFSNRSRVQRRTIPPQNEAAIELGLAFLARHQLPDGSWSLLGFDRGHRLKNLQLDSDTAAVGLSLLAFQGAGYNHKEFKYAKELDRGITWLVSQQRDDGNLYAESDSESNKSCRIYSHAIATLALVEAYGMTQDSDLREPATRAINFLVNSQDRKHGGWRYQIEKSKRESDTSVTGWVVMALQAGRLAGLGENEETWEGIQNWMKDARDAEDEYLFRYNPYAKNKTTAKGVRVRVHGLKPSRNITSIGLLIRIYTEWGKSDPRLLQGADYLLGQLPSDLTKERRDTYYWYYATQVLRHVGGERWKKWEAKLHPLLVKTQVKNGPLAGSWSPYEPVPDSWGRFGGRLYMTTMNLLSLEVNQRYLPLYKKTIE